MVSGQVLENASAEMAVFVKPAWQGSETDGLGLMDAAVGQSILMTWIHHPPQWVAEHYRGGLRIVGRCSARSEFRECLQEALQQYNLQHAETSLIVLVNRNAPDTEAHQIAVLKVLGFTRVPDGQNPYAFAQELAS